MTEAPPGPLRALTPRQLQVADGIRRGLTYSEIAGEMTRLTGNRVSVDTVRTHVRHMAMLFDEPRELAPRWRIYMWVKHREWLELHPERVAAPLDANEASPA